VASRRVALAAAAISAPGVSLFSSQSKIAPASRLAARADNAPPSAESRCTVHCALSAKPVGICCVYQSVRRMAASQESRWEAPWKQKAGQLPVDDSGSKVRQPESAFPAILAGLHGPLGPTRAQLPERPRIARSPLPCIIRLKRG
jgi:hypothetical protein